MPLLSERLSVGILETNCYIVSLDGETAVIDPGSCPEMIAEKLGTRVPSFFILTHTHFDHIGAVPALKAAYPDAKVCFCPKEYTDSSVMKEMTSSAMGADLLSHVSEDVFKLGSPDISLLEGSVVGPFTVLETPGHSAGSICLYSKEDKVLFSGDTLFFHSFGRTDFYGGNEYDMVMSLSRILAMDKDMKVFPGHGRDTTIAEESAYLGMK